jgi:hypothetical protein
MKLYEIANEYRDIDALLDESGGELTPEIEQALAALDTALEAKVDAICGVIRERDADLDGLKLEIDRLKDRAKAVENGTSGLRLYLRDCLERSGKAKVKTPRFTVWQAEASQPTIRYDGDPANLSPEFVRTKVEIDGKYAQLCVKVGMPLPEGFTVTRTKFLGMK